MSIRQPLANYAQPATTGCIPDGIVDQHGQHLTDTVTVSLHDQTVRHVQVHLHASRYCPGRGPIDAFLYQCPDIEFILHQLQLAGRGQRQQVQVVHQPVELVELPHDHPVIARRGRQHPIHQRLQAGLGRRQRGAQLVGNGRTGRLKLTFMPLQTAGHTVEILRQLLQRRRRIAPDIRPRREFPLGNVPGCHRHRTELARHAQGQPDAPHPDHHQ